MSTITCSFRPIPLASFASSSVTSSYQAITPSGGIAYPIFVMKIFNNSSNDVTVSYDGVNDHDYVPKATFIEINFQTNSQPGSKITNMPRGQQVYIKGTAGTGNIYLSGYGANYGANT